jgi:uncharacterized membrane protein
MNAKDFFTAAEREQILHAVKEAEAQTSGEIRVHIDTACKGDVMDETAYWFAQMGMHKTALRNGVLIYLAPNEKKFAIIGDQGINQVVAPDFWDKVKELMQARFREGQFAAGLTEGIKLAGEQLKANFPHQQDDKNELPDTISFDKD